MKGVRRTIFRKIAEIEATDRALARLVRHVDGTAALKDAVVLVSSDHGEGLDDHREDEHGIFVYDETIRVPLVLSGPGIAGGTLRASRRSSSSTGR